MSRRRIFILAGMAVLLLLAVGADQASKAAARFALGSGNVVSLFGGTVVLRYVENQGAFLSLGAWLPPPARRVLFIAFPVAILAAMIVYASRRKDVRGSFAAGMALAAGGGLGNLLDRILRDGRVGDFLNLGIGSLRTGIFNLADLLILTGCVLLLLGDRPARTASELPDEKSGKTPASPG